MKLVAQEIY